MTTRREPPPAMVIAAMAGAIVLGLLLRLWHLGAPSLWNDELFSLFYADASLPFLWTTGFAIETTPPTYYTLLAGWMKLAGHSEFALRLPSVIASTLAIPMVGLIGRDLGGWRCGLIAALIFAVAPMELYYAQEARAYAFMLLPLAAMLWCGVRLQRGLSQPGARPAAALAGYAGAATAAIYFHNTSVLIVAAAGLTGLGVLLARADSARWRMALAWSGANLAIAVLSLPVLLAMAAEVHANRLSWMQPTRLWDVRAALATLVTGPATTPLALQTALALLLAATIAVAMRAVIRTPIASPIVAPIATLIAVPTIDFLLIVASSLRQPILVPRLLCWMWIPLAVLLALLVTAPVRRPTRLALAVATGLALGVGLVFQVRQNETAKEPWKLLLTRIAPLLAQADLVVTGPWTDPMGLKYYGADMTHVAQWSENHAATIENTTIASMLGAPDMTRAQLQDAIRSGRKVVLIQRSVEAKYLALLDVAKPAGAVAQPCWAMGICMAATYWNMLLPSETNATGQAR